MSKATKQHTALSATISSSARSRMELPSDMMSDCYGVDDLFQDLLLGISRSSVGVVVGILEYCELTMAGDNC